MEQDREPGTNWWIYMTQEALRSTGSEGDYSITVLGQLILHTKEMTADPFCTKSTKSIPDGLRTLTRKQNFNIARRKCGRIYFRP